MKAPTVYDVAERAGVSIATVSRVLRSPHVVRESTVTRVMDVVRELGYLPSGNARGLAARRTNVIGLFLPGHDAVESFETLPPLDDGAVRIVVDDAGGAPESRDLYFDEVMRGVEVEAWHRGLALMIAVGRGASTESLAGDIAGRVDGLAVLASTVSDDLLAQLARRIPVVLLAGPRRGDALDHIGVDNAGGLQAIADFVIAGHGIRRIAYIAGPSSSPDAVERRAGLNDSLAANGLSIDDVRVVEGDFSRVGGRAAAAVLLEDAVMPRAVICANDQMAIGVLELFAERGVRVPEDVMVTGFDGIAAGRSTTPRLTTVHQPMMELGRAAVEAITARLDDPSLPPLSRTLPVEIRLRESCPPLA